MSEFNIKYMEKALELAREAFQDDEVPVGAVIVRNGEIVATGRNRREKEKNALLHAETDAINNACKVLGGWRLWNCDIYVTLEPCPMCAGALNWAQIGRIVFGTPDPKRGYSMFTPSLLHPKTQVRSGVLADECSALMIDFFREKR